MSSTKTANLKARPARESVGCVLLSSSPRPFESAMASLSVPGELCRTFSERAEGLCLLVGPLARREAQEVADLAMALGGVGWASRAFPGQPPPHAGVLLAGTPSQMEALAGVLGGRSGTPSEVSRAIGERLLRMKRPKRLLVGGKDLLRERRYLVMGVVNVTPDSFSDGERYLDPKAAVAHGVRLAEEGADILDVGAESSRPGSDPVPAEEERRRLLPVVEGLRGLLPELPLSVDTTKADVAEAALQAGADMVNDISAGGFDPGMVPLCAGRGVPLVLMHMRGVPKTMQEAPRYEDPVVEVALELEERVRAAEAAGLGEGTLVTDPGIGFGKRPEDNAALLSRLESLSGLGHPVLVGASRKSLIGAFTGAPVEDRIPGSLALHAAALLGGATIFRVHDVKEHVQALACVSALA